MARSGAASLLVVCVLAAMGMCAVSFVGSPGAATRAPAVAMNFFGDFLVASFLVDGEKYGVKYGAIYPTSYGTDYISAQMVVCPGLAGS